MINQFSLEERLEKLGLRLPALSKPAGNYVVVNVQNNIAYAIQFPKFNEGDVGHKAYSAKDLTTETAIKQCSFARLIMLAHIGMQQ